MRYSTYFHSGLSTLFKRDRVGAPRLEIVSQIARTELAAMFFSPVAWLLLVVFLVQTALAYFGRIETIFGYLLAGIEGYSNFTRLIFDTRTGALSTLSTNLVLYIPVLCMGLFSRELSSGSIKLLTSSPIRFVEIVVGKYLAVVTYLLLFVAFLTALALTTGLVISEPDYARIAVGVFGIFLLACAYAAIGLFMSSLTTHQVVAALSTLGLLAALEFIGRVGQSVPIVDDIAYWLSISGRADILIDGLLVSSDVVYFLLLIVLFLTLTTLRLAAGKKSQKKSVMVAKYGGVLACVVVAGVVSSLPQLTISHDATRIQSNTLSQGSLEAIEALEGPWRITTYVNVLDIQAQRFLPRERNTFHRRQYSQYQRENPYLSLDYVYYYAPVEAPGLYAQRPGKTEAEIAEFYAAQYGMSFQNFLSEDEVRERIDLDGEVIPNFYHIQWSEADTILRNFADINYVPGEAHISAALSRLTSGPVNLAYVTGHGERSITVRGAEHHRFIVSDVTNRFALANHGFEVSERTLDAPVSREDVDILVLAAPQTPLSSEARNHLADYIAQGGNLLIAAEPGSEDVLNPILDGFGVELLAGQLSQPHEEYTDQLIFSALAEGPSQADAFPETAEFSARGQAVLMEGTAALRYRPGGPFTITPLLVAETSAVITNADQALNTEPKTTALLLTRAVNEGQEQRILITADADFMGEFAIVGRSDKPLNNLSFFQEAFRWLGEGRYPIDTSRPVAPDSQFLVGMAGINGLRAVILVLFPIGLLATGGALLLHRRRR